MEMLSLQVEPPPECPPAPPVPLGCHSAAWEIAHALNNVMATIVSAVSLLRAERRSELDVSLLDLLETAARSAEVLGSRVAGLGARVAAQQLEAQA
jgi:hypothetical protein